MDAWRADLDTVTAQFRASRADMQGCGPMQYPPASVEKAAQAIFLHGATAQAAWQAKLAMLVYYLLDAGLPLSQDSFMCVFAGTSHDRMSAAHQICSEWL